MHSLALSFSHTVYATKLKLTLTAHALKGASNFGCPVFAHTLHSGYDHLARFLLHFDNFLLVHHLLRDDLCRLLLLLLVLMERRSLTCGREQNWGQKIKY